jgi:hypothetical protein
MAFRNSALAVTTTLAPIYTGPVGYETVIHSLFISNTDSVNTIEVDIQAVFTHGANSGTVYLGKGLTIPAGTSLIFDKSITLRAWDTLNIKASANTCNAVASMLVTVEDTVIPD